MEQHQENGASSEHLQATEVAGPAAGAPPSQADVLGLLPFGGRGSPLELLVTASTKIEEWGPRTILTDMDVANINEIMAEDEALDKGHMDVTTFLWRKAVLVISVGGRGRQDFKDVAGAATRRESLLKGVLNGGLTPPEEKGGPRT